VPGLPFGAATREPRPSTPLEPNAPARAVWAAPVTFDRALLRDLVVIGSDGLLGILGALLLFASSEGLWSILLGAFGAMLPDPLHTIHAHFPHEPLRSLQRFHRWIHTDKRIKTDLILGVGSQIALVAVVVGLVMMAQYGVLDQALAK
jgi:hypothetical protein